MKDTRWQGRLMTIRLLWGLFAAALVLAVVAQIFVPVHGHFEIDNGFAFNAWYAFAVCIGMIAFSKVLGIFLKRRDSYYGGDTTDDE